MSGEVALSLCPLFYKGTNPIHDLIFSQRPHFQTPSPWGNRFPHMNFGETQTFSLQQLNMYLQMHFPYNLVIPLLNLYLCFSNFSGYQNSLEGLLKPRLLGSTLRVFSSVGLVWGLRICISNKFPGDGDDGPGTTL